jgi:hypothetical protein
MGCCLLSLVLIGAPRIALFLWWLFQPGRFAVTFGNFLVPLLGLLILPWTTLMYLFVFPGGVTGFEWLLVIVAFLVDIGSYGGGGRAYRSRS